MTLELILLRFIARRCISKPFAIEAELVMTLAETQAQVFDVYEGQWRALHPSVCTAHFMKGEDGGVELDVVFKRVSSNILLTFLPFQHFPSFSPVSWALCQHRCIRFPPFPSLSAVTLSCSHPPFQETVLSKAFSIDIALQHPTPQWVQIETAEGVFGFSFFSTEAADELFERVRDYVKKKKEERAKELERSAPAPLPLSSPSSPTSESATASPMGGLLAEIKGGKALKKVTTPR